MFDSDRKDLRMCVAAKISKLRKDWNQKEKSMKMLRSNEQYKCTCMSTTSSIKERKLKRNTHYQRP